MLFTQPLPSASSSQFVEKYRPRKVADFIGSVLDSGDNGPKLLCASIVANPFAQALMFHGPSGTGKTSMALALAEELQAEVHHIASHECDLAAVANIRNACQHLPAPGKRLHVVIVDEADEMTRAAQTSLLSMLDAANPLPDTIWIFTANETEGLHPRFLSRTTLVPFSVKGMAKGAADLLARVWAAEAPADAVAPNFDNMVKVSNTNVRAALNALQGQVQRASIARAA